MKKYLKVVYKHLKAKFPRQFKKLQEIRMEKYYKYLKSLDRSEYPKELSKIYKKNTGEALNWENIRSYNEKMQWAKIYDMDPRKTILADKYLVREWVKDKIGEEHLIPLLGVWNSFNEIDFDSLPNRFVLKTNHGSSTNLIVKDKNDLDKNEAKQLFDRWMSLNFAFLNGFEMHYKDIPPKIIAEQYMDNEGRELEDYKFLCFDGHVSYCWIDVNRYSDHRRNIYDIDWNLQKWQQHNYKNTDNSIVKPNNFDLMVRLAEKLAKGFSHVRVDFYNINGKVYFGEMTFTNGSGFELIHPIEYNLMLGHMWEFAHK